MPTLHVVITKEFTFRGQPERFSNGYNFQTGTNVVDAFFAKDVALAVRNQEMTFHASSVRFVYAVAGLKDQDAIWSEELGAAGPVGAKAPEFMHPEVCVMAESKKKNRVYLRKFFHTHAHLGNSAAQSDQINPADATPINNALLKFTDGNMPGGVKACFPNGDLALAPFTCDGYLRTRQLKRRGRRPTP